MVPYGKRYVQLGRTILGIFGSLLLTSPAKIPEHDLAVIAGTGQYALLKWMPRERSYGVVMTFKRMQFGLQIT